VQTHFRAGRPSPRALLALSALVALSLVAAACGGDSNGNGGGSAEPTGDPTPGGKVVYALEAETPDGFCLPEATLAISGIQVARTIYDTLVQPNEDGEYEPYLAESVEPNDTYDEWTITLREGVKFHDGSDLTAEVVKNNLDAYRGAYPSRNPLLFLFVFQNIENVEVADELTVTVTTKTPWPAMPATLFASGRVGIMGQAQLDDESRCATNLIGTGPFKLEQWDKGVAFRATKNTDYWGRDADGNQLPYLDEIEYRPFPDGGTRVQALLAGDVDVIHTSSAEQQALLRQDEEAGAVNLISTDEYTEVSYGMMNSSKPPFDNIKARRAVAAAIDLETFNQVVNRGELTNATGPFAPGSVGHVEDTDMPDFDPELAERLVSEYEEETGQKLTFTLHHTPDNEVTAAAQLLQEMVRKVGIEADLRPVEQAALIETVIGSDWQIASFRNHPGGDPDTQYVWWHSTMPTNFGKFKDEEIDRLLDEGRQSADQERRAEIYQDVNRRLGEQVYNYWLQWSRWAIASDSSVFGIMGPDLPSGAGPFPGLATGHPVTTLWVQQ
jgi:peptide/nickel transport system substrate-binding protein